MQKYVEKMITEQKDLEGKLKRAKNAIEKNPFDMNKTQKMLLAQQVKHMESYLDVLNQRIDYETKEKPNEVNY